MPLTNKGEKILENLTKEYGSKEKAEQILYAGKNKGTFTGIDERRAAVDCIMDGRRQRLADARARRQTAVDAIMDARRKRLADSPQFHSKFMESEDYEGKFGSF